MNDKKTTVGGIVGAVGAVVTFAGYWIANGVPPAPSWVTLFSALSLAAGLIFAADSKK